MDPILDWITAAATYVSPDTRLSWQQDLVALHVASDIIISMSFVVMALGAVWVLLHRLNMTPMQRSLAWLFAAFLLFAGGVQFSEVVTLWYPLYGIQGFVKATGALVSVVTVAFMLPALPGLARIPSPQELTDANERLRVLSATHDRAVQEFNETRADYEKRLAELTRLYELTKARFETALREADIYAFSQDSELRYTWVFSPRGEESAAKMVGRTDDEIPSSPEHDSSVAVKRRVLKTGTAEECEVTYTLPEGRAVYAMRIHPIFAVDQTINGIMCTAINFSRMHSRESELRQRAEKLETTLQRYDTALRGSNVTVYTQDLGLRYVSISAPILGLDVSQIVGRTDQDILPVQSRDAIIALKKEAIDAGRPKDCEVCIHDGTVERWYDLHMEPLREVTGASVGLICASVDVTARKEGEVHLRLLMRELTHRSKNLLAVIQAMARQTARRAETIDGFTERFGARLQALATSHDLLIQESWHGALLSDLVRSQLGHYLDREGSQFSIEGPSVFLKPEAAQNIGLALHELATNAAKYGALSVPSGRVSISWRRKPDGGSPGVEIIWVERGGPSVQPPDQRGFGSIVIERNLSRALEADVHLTFEQQGIECRIVVPESLLVFGR